MRIDSAFELPLLAYSTVRSAFFTAEFQLLNSISKFLPSTQFKPKKIDLKTLLLIRKELFALLKRDSRNIAQGLYPVSVLEPESVFEHALRIPKIVRDGVSVYRRRKQGKTTEFDKNAQELLSELPRYYRRNFHFQTGGYLSETSAELYEHQVEMLFSGAADAMRRMIVEAMKNHFSARCDGKGLKFLEIGAGTGRATRFVRLAFPKAKIVACDLSDPYLKFAKKKLAGFSRIDYAQADGASLPFLADQFDAVYSVFLFHELPMQAREKVLEESRRVLKPKGFIGLVDSIQAKDHAEFDSLLEEFPIDYHEPFYRNYIAHPMEALLKNQGFKAIESSTGFFSKLCHAVK